MFNKKEQANFSEEKEVETLFYACQSATMEGKGNTWYVDSGCSNHMTGDDEVFLSMNKEVTIPM